jgi:hypothetical protein
MGTYNLSKEEIADILESIEDEGRFGGDFSERDFLEGVKLFIKNLRKQGAYIPK